MTTFLRSFHSPLGDLTAAVTECDAVLSIAFVDEPGVLPDHIRARLPGPFVSSTSRAQAVVDQVRQYFHDGRRTFELTLAPRGTDFQHQVWLELRRIPYGCTVSYSELASQVTSGGARAVGRANATNPIAIVIPCHRVIGAIGALTGYAGGIERKARLLQLEGATLI
jgi:methylated-DNA-[protein]-cysteine S-methyltransferase